MKGLHPELQSSYKQRLETVRSFEEVLANRQLSHYSESGLTFEQCDIEDITLDQLRVIRLSPKALNTVAPAIVWMHGGGMVFGQPDDAIAYLVEYVTTLHVTVFIPQYRLAPENPYPAAVEDGYKVLQWASENSKALHIDRNNIIVGGASAGGNLALAISMIARDNGGPAIAGIISSYPMLDPKPRAAHEAFTSPAYWNIDKNTKGWAAYLKGHEELPTYASPLYGDVSNLPPIYTFIGTHDMFYEEVLEFIEKVKAANGTITYHLYEGCPHSFDLEDVPIAALAKKRTIEAAAQFIAR